jgi:hypothetical protein
MVQLAKDVYELVYERLCTRDQLVWSHTCRLFREIHESTYERLNVVSCVDIINHPDVYDRLYRVIWRSIRCKEDAKLFQRMIAKYKRNNYDNICQALYMALCRDTMGGFEDVDHNVFVDDNRRVRGFVWKLDFPRRLMGTYATRWASRMAETVQHIDRLISENEIDIAGQRDYLDRDALRMLGQKLVYSNHEPDVIISAVNAFPSLLPAGIARYTDPYYRPRLGLGNFPTMLLLVPTRPTHFRLEVARILMCHNSTLDKKHAVYNIVMWIFQTIPVREAARLTDPFRECDAIANNAIADGYNRKYAAKKRIEYIDGMMKLFASNRPLWNAVVDLVLQDPYTSDKTKQAVVDVSKRFKPQ